MRALAVVWALILQLEAAPESWEAPELPQDVVKGEFIVRFRPGVSAVQRQTLAQALGGEWVTLVPTPRNISRHSTSPGEAEPPLLLRTGTVPGTALTLRVLQQSPDVLYAEPNFRLHLFEKPSVLPRPFPDDYEFPRQWSLKNRTVEDGKKGADIAMEQAWKVTTGDRRIVVAVIDTGVDFFHPDLAPNIWTNPGETGENGLDDDGNGYVDDVHGYDFVSNDGDPYDDLNHGTHVAGIIGAVGNNQQGIAGVCWQVSIMALKAFDEAGDSDVAHVISAIYYAIRSKAQIINASWGGTDRSQGLEEAINRASEAGILVVAAAGNEHIDTAPTPAAYPVTVAVGATDAWDQRAFFSNFGKWVDLAAPGTDIYSTFPDATFELSSGTSMAAPHVTGVAALVWSLHPDFSNEDVRNVLLNTADAIDPDHPLGVGRVNAARAVAVREKLPGARLTVDAVVDGYWDINGSADGETFESYELAISRGAVAASAGDWIVLRQSTASISQGVLCAGVDTSLFSEGQHQLRLVVRGQSGQVAQALDSVEIRNIRLTQPLNNDVLRAGEVVEIRGNVFGGGLEYSVSYGEGWSPNQWFDGGLEIVRGGREERLREVLARWDTSRVPGDRFYTLRLVARKAGKTVSEWQTPMIYLDSRLRAGWPKRLPIVADFPVGDWRQVAVADLDRDGRQELILVDQGNSEGKPAELKVFRDDGLLWWSRTLGAGEPYSDVPVIGDLDGDGRLEILVDAGASQSVFAFRWDGTDFGAGWPVSLGGGNLGKVLADLDHDGKLELITLSREETASTGFNYRQLSVVNWKGQIVRQWNVPQCDFEEDAPELIPAVGNLDDDEDLEIVTNYGCGAIALFDLKKAEGPVWASYADARFRSAPVIGDVNGDGKNEIIVTSYDPDGRNRGGVHVYDASGRRWAKFPLLLEESFANAPALADLDGDGALDICVASASQRRVHVLRGNGTELTGWPVGEGLNGVIRTGPVIGDVDGDGQPDVVLPVLGSMRQLVSFGDLTRAGGVMAWKSDGTPIRWGGPKGPYQLVMEAAGGGNRLKAAPVTLTDLDGDGKLDVIAASIQEAAYDLGDAPVVRKNRSSLYIWNVNTPFDPATAPWPVWQHDNARSGAARPRVLTNTPPVMAKLPGQVARSGGRFFPVRLDRYVEDKEDARPRLVWSVGGAVELRASIDAARQLHVEAPSNAWSGRETLTLTVRDTGGLTAGQEVVFEMRADFEPPVPKDDVFKLDEDGVLDMDVLANDRDALGAPVQLLEFSRAEHGRVTLLPGGHLRYTPDADFNGTDGFTYSAIDSKGGVAMASVEIQVTPVDDAPRPQVDQIIGLEDEVAVFDVLKNDLEPDGQELTLSGFSQPEKGDLIDLGKGVFEYHPPTNYFGADRFTYTVRDPSGNEAQAVVNITLKPVVDLPVAANQTLTVNRNQSKDINYQAANPDGGKLQYKVVEGPKHGDLWTYPDLATYFPKQGYSGRDSFTYVANNGFDDGPIATVTIQVTNTNNPPVLEPLELSVKPGRLLSLPLVVKDVDEDPFTIELLNPAVHGKVSGSGTNWTYQSAGDYLGDDDFVLAARDQESSSGSIGVRIHVTDQNTPPESFDSKQEILANTSTNLVFDVKDKENDPLRFEILQGPERGSLTGQSPTFRYTPQPDFLGYDRVVFRAHDGLEWSEPSALTILVRIQNEPPVSTNQTFRVLTGKVLRGSLQVSDADRDVVRCPVLKGPKHGRVVIQGTNFIYTSSAGFLGGDTFTYRAWDGHRYGPVTKVTVSVETPTPPQPPSFGPLDIASNGQLRLTFKAKAGSICRLEASDDLSSWASVASLRFLQDEASWIDPETGEHRRRFYRLVLESFPASE